MRRSNVHPPLTWSFPKRSLDHALGEDGIRNSAYDTFPDKKIRLGLEMLFASGNGTPDDPLAGAAGLMEFNRGMDYRGTLALVEILLQRDSNQSIIDVSCQYHGFPGYTPLDFPMKSKTARFMRAGAKLLRKYPTGTASAGGKQFERGPGRVVPPVSMCSADQEFCVITTSCEFKLSEKLNELQKRLTGHRAPSAWVSIDYLVRANGEVGIRYGGSAVPTLFCYTDWVCGGKGHDMMENAHGQIRDFIEGPDCERADGEVWYTWPQGFRWSEAEMRAMWALRNLNL